MKNVVSVIALSNFIGDAGETYETGTIELNILGKN
jgi:hypothetical protein